MFKISSIVIIVSLILKLLLAANCDVINKQVHRNIDISTSIVRVSSTIQALGVTGHYVLCFPRFLSKHLASLTVTWRNKSIVPTPVMLNDDQSHVYFEIDVFETEHSPTFTVYSVFTNYLYAFPFEMEQHGDQFVLYDDNLYFHSMYKTMRQKTTVTLPHDTHGANVLSYTKAEPFALKRNVLSYGTFLDVEPLKYENMRIHFLNNDPFGVLHNVVREISWNYVSSNSNTSFIGFNWVHVDEQCELGHQGAKLINAFSREYKQRTHSHPPASNLLGLEPGMEWPSFSRIMTRIPMDSRYLYYRDSIGSMLPSTITEKWHHPLLGEDPWERELELGLRIPLYGGWSTDFNIGYTVPLPVTYEASTDIGNEHEIYKGYASFYSISTRKYYFVWNYASSYSVPTPVMRNSNSSDSSRTTYAGSEIQIDNLISRFQLPYGAFNIDLCTQLPHGSHHARFTRQTVLGALLGGGQTVIQITSSNVGVDMDRDPQTVMISYELNTWGWGLGLVWNFLLHLVSR